MSPLCQLSTAATYWEVLWCYLRIFHNFVWSTVECLGFLKGCWEGTCTMKMVSPHQSGSRKCFILLLWAAKLIWDVGVRDTVLSADASSVRTWRKKCCAWHSLTRWKPMCVCSVSTVLRRLSQTVIQKSNFYSLLSVNVWRFPVTVSPSSIINKSTPTMGLF